MWYIKSNQSISSRLSSNSLNKKLGMGQVNSFKTSLKISWVKKELFQVGFGSWYGLGKTPSGWVMTRPKPTHPNKDKDNFLCFFCSVSIQFTWKKHFNSLSRILKIGFFSKWKCRHQTGPKLIKRSSELHLKVSTYLIQKLAL